jgi:DNA polymerase
MIFYDFEVFKYDWLVVYIDTEKQIEKAIVNNIDELRQLYAENSSNIWVGFNNKHYDQYIFKGILLGMNPKEINDKIIAEGKEGWQISRQFNKVPMINYDVFATKSLGLKTLEAFMGVNIKESDVDFKLDRKLTDEEIAETIKYCTSDVDNTFEVFMHRINNFNAMHGIIKAFPEQTSIRDIGESSARITAKVLECVRQDHNDEFDFFFLPCLRIKKYKAAVDWFSSLIGNPNHIDPYLYYKQSFNLEVAGVPHVFGFGGLHGAPNKPIHRKGAIYHVDVNNYYPSMLIAWDLVTRNATNDNYAKVYKIRKALKMKQLAAKTREEAKMYKLMQDPYKVMLNGLSGAMKDKKNDAFDPRNNNIMCINGQLMLLDLIEHLEAIDGFELLQSNTDGLIVQIPDTDEAFQQLDDICYEWERRCSTEKCDIGLATDQIAEIYQKDVNNYLWIDLDGGIEKKGSYVKELSPLDYDLPIVNEAITEYMAHKIPVEETINSCNELIKFQKVVKLSAKYEYVEHNGKQLTYKCYRVFASKDPNDGQILKCKHTKRKIKIDSDVDEIYLKKDKFGVTPDHCFIENSDVREMPVPELLDKQWYIDLAKKRLGDYGICVK